MADITDEQIGQLFEKLGLPNPVAAAPVEEPTNADFVPKEDYEKVLHQLKTLQGQYKSFETQREEFQKQTEKLNPLLQLLQPQQEPKTESIFSEFGLDDKTTKALDSISSSIGKQAGKIESNEKQMNDMLLDIKLSGVMPDWKDRMGTEVYQKALAQQYDDVTGETFNQKLESLASVGNFDAVAKLVSKIKSKVELKDDGDPVIMPNGSTGGPSAAPTKSGDQKLPTQTEYQQLDKLSKTDGEGAEAAKKIVEDVDRKLLSGEIEWNDLKQQ